MEIQVNSSNGQRFIDSSVKHAPVDKPLIQANATSPIESGSASSSAFHLPSHMPDLSPLSHIQPTPNLSPIASDSAPLFTQQQQAPLAMPFGMPGFNMMSFPPQMLTMFAQQPATTQSPMPTQPSSMMPQVQENFTTALMDIMKMYGTLPGGGPGAMSGGQWPMFPNMMAQQMSQSAGSSGSASMVLEDSGASSSRRVTESPSLLSPQGPNSHSVLLPPVKRKRKFDAVEDGFGNEVLETEDSGHEEDGEPPLAALYKKNKAEERESKWKQKNTNMRRARRSSLLPLPTPSRNAHQTSSSGDLSQKLFAHDNGKPMHFFVQVDMNNRQEVTRAIKVSISFQYFLVQLKNLCLQKHGGVITPHIPGADYAVLHPFSTSFKSLLSQAIGAQTHAVTHHFVLDSIDEGSIPNNMGDYTLKSKQTPQARRRDFENAVKAKSKSLEKDSKQLEKNKKELDMKHSHVAWSEIPESVLLATSTVKKATQKSADCPTQIKDEEGCRPARIVKPKNSGRIFTPVPTVKRPTFPMAQSSTSGPITVPKNKGKKSGYFPREATPPLPVTTQRYAAGYLYTQEEKDWAERYLFILFKRDPSTSLTAASKALCRKVCKRVAGVNRQMSFHHLISRFRTIRHILGRHSYWGPSDLSMKKQGRKEELHIERRRVNGKPNKGRRNKRPMTKKSR